MITSTGTHRNRLLVWLDSSFVLTWNLLQSCESLGLIYLLRHRYCNYGTIIIMSTAKLTFDDSFME